MKRERDSNNCCGKNIRYRGEPTGEIKPRAAQEEARLYIGHEEYVACHLFSGIRSNGKWPIALSWLLSWPLETEKWHN